MSKRIEGQNMILSHLTMRRALGIAGFFLPLFPLFCGGSFDLYYSLCPSISAFYHSQNILIRGFFVGALVFIGVFLVSYRGYKRQHDEYFSDNLLASMAGIGAIGFAVIPVPEKCVFYDCGSCVENLHNLMHYGSLLLFLGAAAWMSFYKFTRHDGSRPPNKRKRNKVCQVCAVVILFFVVVLVGQFFLSRYAGMGELMKDLRVVFFSESLALWAFAISWLIKGRGFYAD